MARTCTTAIVPRKCTVPWGSHPQQEAVGGPSRADSGMPSACTGMPSTVRRMEYGGRNGSGIVNRGCGTVRRAQCSTGEREVAKLAATREPANCRA